MTIDEIMQALEAFGNPSTKRTLIRHGAKVKRRHISKWNPIQEPIFIRT